MTAIHDSAKAHGYRLKSDDRPTRPYPRVRASGRAYASCDGPQGTERQSRIHARIVQTEAARERCSAGMLYNHVETPEFICRFRWQQNSVAFWDNRTTSIMRHLRLFPAIAATACE